MASVRMKLNSSGFNKLRKSKPVKAAVDRMADDMAAEAGDGYMVKSNYTTERYRAAVITATAHAMNSNAKHNTLNRILASRRAD